MLPWWLSGKEPACQCRTRRFDPWVRKIPWRRKWQSTPVFLPGKSHGQRSLVGYSSWGRKESDTTERLHFTSLHLLSFLNGSNNFLCILSVTAAVSLLMRISLTARLQRGQSHCSISQSSFRFFCSFSKFVSVLPFMCSFMSCLSSFAFVLFFPIKMQAPQSHKTCLASLSFLSFHYRCLVHKTCSINIC